MLDFQKSREAVRKLNIKSVKEWKALCRSGLKPIDIPWNPSIQYKTEWCGFPDWLGYVYDKRTYTVKEDFFLKWSDDMAYILGLWYTDGWISKRHEFCIGLHKKDSYLLSNIAERMGSNVPIDQNRNMSILRICSKKICDSIRQLGGKENKSLDIKFPDIPENYFSHFLRGVWDGDGSIFRIKKSGLYQSSLVCGSEKFISELWRKIHRSLQGIKGSYIIPKIRHGVSICGVKVKSPHQLYKISFSNNDTIRIGNFMYSGNQNLKLNRKYEVFLGITYREQSPVKNTWDFITAKKFAVSTGSKSKRQIFKFYKENGKPKEMPYNPNLSFKKQWNGWKDFLNANDHD